MVSMAVIVFGVIILLGVGMTLWYYGSSH